MRVSVSHKRWSNQVNIKSKLTVEKLEKGVKFIQSSLGTDYMRETDSLLAHLGIAKLSQVWKYLLC